MANFINVSEIDLEINKLQHNTFECSETSIYINRPKVYICFKKANGTTPTLEIEQLECVLENAKKIQKLMDLKKLGENL